MHRWIGALACAIAFCSGVQANAQDSDSLPNSNRSQNTGHSGFVFEHGSEQSSDDAIARRQDESEANYRAMSEQISALQKQVDDLQNKIQESKNSAVDNSHNGTNSFARYVEDRFTFGSYGRVQPSMNPDGMQSGRQARIVYPAPRVDEGSYVELYFKYTPYKSDTSDTVVDLVTTLALDGDNLFHYDGDWNAGIAIRNLYVEARNLWFDGFTVWAGSRMYRGDDIYLLDTWPLDNLNTYGGGIGWHGKTRTNIDIHFGTNRLKNDYQYEVVDVVNERFVGKQDVVFLDRQRFITSIKAEQFFGGDELPTFKAKLYAEIHAIGKGQFLKTQPELVTELPDDTGWLVGAQFGMSDFLGGSYVNLFFKYASGLAAYGDQTIPFGVATDMRAKDAKNVTIGLSAGIDVLDYVDILFGGYARYFEDADGIEQDFDDGWEGVWDIRITGHVGQYFRPGIEFSQQLRRPNGLSPVNHKQELASLFKFSLLPAVRFGEGVLGRPEIRFNYTVSVLNSAAQNLFAERDYLRNNNVVHFVGIAAEWWFNI